MRASARCDRGENAQRRGARARAWGRACAWALAVGWAAALLPARAEEKIAVSYATVTVRSGADPGTFVNAQFDLALPAALRDAVDHGIALYFAIEIEVSRSRWWWFDKILLDDAIEYRLSFSPLTRQYRLARGGLALPFDSLDQALATLRRVTQWRIGDSSLFEASNTQGRIRMHLDTSMLPKPFQVSALTDPDWILASDWYRLTLAPERPN